VHVHENFTLKLKALGITYDSNFFEQNLCENEDLTNACWKGLCEACSHGKLLTIEGEPESEKVWEEWRKNEDG